MEHINIGKKYTNDDLGFVPQKKKSYFPFEFTDIYEKIFMIFFFKKKASKWPKKCLCE